MDTVLTWAEQYQTEIAVVGGILVVLLLGWLAYRTLRARRRARPVDRPSEIVRRPIYTDVDLLDDLRAHGERRSDPPTPTDVTDRSEETRRLNETLAALEGSDVLIDLDRDPTIELEVGKAVVLTGTLERHPASEAAEILELSAPLLLRSGAGGDGTDENGETATMTRAAADAATGDTAPVVVRLDHRSARHGYLMVLPREHLRVPDPVNAGAPVSVLAVVEQVLGRRDEVAVEDYLGPHLSSQGRSVLGDRDLAETIATLSDVAHEDLGAKDLRFKGPGALLTPAAIHR